MKHLFSTLTCLILLLVFIVMPAEALTDQYGSGGSAGAGIFSRTSPEQTTDLTYEQGETLLFTATSPRGTLAEQDSIICGLTAATTTPTDLYDAEQGLLSDAFLYVGQVTITTNVSSFIMEYSAVLDSGTVEPGTYAFWLLHYRPPTAEAAASYSYLYQTVTITASAQLEPEPEPAPLEPGLAQPTASTVYVDGYTINFDAYNIEDNNYFKLRDIAYVLNGTSAQFEVEWNAAANAIQLFSGQRYTSVGGEMSINSSPSAKQAQSTAAQVVLDGREVQLSAYNIDGNNYFKLRDIGQCFDFNVTWNAATNAIHINTDQSYTLD